jgi:drug/metabolite transporter (DMT)-like permease
VGANGPDTVPGVSSTSVPAAPPAPQAPPTVGPFGATEWALFMAIGTIWGASFLLIDIGLDAFRPGLITMMRVTLGAITLSVLPRQPITLEPADSRRLIWISVIWVAIPFTLFPLAEQHINSATTGLLNGATPIFTAVIAAAMYRQRPTSSVMSGLIVGFVGVALISVPTINQGSSEATGVAMVVAATFCYGVATNLASPLLRKYGPLVVMRRILVLAAIWTAPLGVSQVSGSRFDVGSLLAVVALGVIGTGAAHLIMVTWVRRVGPTRSSFITYVIPVVSLILGVVFRDDTVPALALAGIALVISGAALAGRSRG